MALKQWMKEFQPMSIYIVLTLTLVYFLLQLVISYMTHSLTLTIDSYLMLCNLIALFGCIITLRVCNDENSTCSSSNFDSENSAKSNPSENSANSEFVKCSDPKSSYFSPKHSSLEKRLKNTFGWARVDVLVMLIGCVVFCSLCFSSVIEAIQILLHISHNDEAHSPIVVFAIGAFGLVLNGLAYVLIGGYTFHHGSCLRVTPSGMVVLTGDVLKVNGQRRLNFRSQSKSSPRAREMLFVMIGGGLVYYIQDHNVSKFVDPIISIILACFLLILNFPYMKESCYILLQTIPNHINIDSLCKELTNHFPMILNIHDLHVWEFTRRKTFLTAHIIFMNPQVYANMKQDIMNFFHERGISVVTIQPEFFKDSNNFEMISSLDNNCLVKCASAECYQRYCCDLIDGEALESICIPKLQDIPCCCPKVEATPVISEQQSCATDNVKVNNDVQSSKDVETDNGDENSQKSPEELKLVIEMRIDQVVTNDDGPCLQSDL
ncbi:hypothetical protein V9T40_005383 [Parthenolecanium corni]|uniref:Cation efflux protein transmembrane domain-containing protein n=1 Tax=Parthenolecanium corni TaxID=536013 RepID=A0AAN9TIM9_9HEMI